MFSRTYRCLVLSCLINLVTWIYNFKQEIKSNQHWQLSCERRLFTHFEPLTVRGTPLFPARSSHGARNTRLTSATSCLPTPPLSVWLPCVWSVCAQQGTFTVYPGERSGRASVR